MKSTKQSNSTFIVSWHLTDNRLTKVVHVRAAQSATATTTTVTGPLQDR
ncbi:hypothetical protein POX_e06385 [Penicillium oxalicum]|nr:hypothetical protein POX_e06385 [Penicillium oxalicum]KAI2788370.1 hypothetical protein POX_e06385 [Penicillium oxalicum]